jgi:hypothetical protein
MPGGSPHERAYAFRALAKLQPERCKHRLLEAILASPHEPEPFLALAELAYVEGDQAAVLHYARHAAACDPRAMSHTSDPRAYGPRPHDLACVAAWRLQLLPEAVAHAREAFKRDPADQRLAGNLSLLEKMNHEDGPKAA